MEVHNAMDPQDQPYYYGMYLNMARNNILQISNALAKRFEAKEIQDDGRIVDSFLTRYRENNPNHLYSHLYHFLNFAKEYDPEVTMTREERADIKYGKDYQGLARDLKAVFKDINGLRNAYSHKYSLHSRFITDATRKFVDKMYHGAVRVSKKRHADVIDAAHFDRYAEEKLHETTEEGIRLTTAGLVFLTNLFLTRTQIFHYIGKIRGFKNSTTPEFRAKREIFSCFAAKMPRERLLSSDPEMSLKLDVINELAKVPYPLYNVLQAKDKEKFASNLDEEALKNVLDNSVSDAIDDWAQESYASAITTKYRRSDRFNYFALRLIDQYNILANFLPQIYLGKFVLDRYMKPINDDEDDRQIIAETKAFGSLLSFQDKEEEVLAEITKKSKDHVDDSIHHFINYSPKYHINHNKIYLYYSAKPNSNNHYPNLISKEGRQRMRAVQPGVALSIYELPKILMLESIAPGRANELLVEFVNRNRSLNDVNNLKAEININWENEIKSHHRNAGDKRKARISKLNIELAKIGLNHKQIPRAWVDELINYTGNSKQWKKAQWIKSMKKDARDRIKDYHKGKYPKIGVMATAVAQDIKDMIIDLEIKEGFTNFYYDRMQEALALYNVPEKRALFQAIVAERGLLNAKKGHPFLHKIGYQQFESIHDLYLSYFDEKGGCDNGKRKDSSGKGASWIYRTYYQREGNKTKIALRAGKPEPYLLKAFTQATSEDAKQHSTAIDLPTNLLDAALGQAIGNVSADNKYNMQFKLQYGLDNVQDFYNYEREYWVSGHKYLHQAHTLMSNLSHSQLSGQIIEDLKQTVDFTKLRGQQRDKAMIQMANRSIRRSFTAVEKDIRLIMERDIILAQLYASKDQSMSDLKLIDVSDYLNTSVEIKHRLGGKNIVATRKYKDHGFIKKILHNQVLKTLLPYIDLDEIAFDQVLDMLKEYHDTRISVFAQVFELEEKIYAKDEEGVIKIFEAEGINSKEITFRPYLMWLQSKGVVNEEECAMLREVRNAFAHNKVPQLAQIATSENSPMPMIEEGFTNLMKEVLNRIDEID